MFSVRRKKLVGIDIGTNSIKVVRLKGLKDNEISTIAYRDTGCKDYGDEKFCVSAKAILADIVKEKKLSQCGAVSIIDDPSISFINIQLPPMPKSDLVSAVRFEVKKQLTYPIEEAVVDFFIRERESERNPKITLTSVSVHKEAVIRHMEIIRNAGLKPLAVEISAIPLAAAHDFNHHAEPNQKIALLDISASKSTLVIVMNKAIRFYRELPIFGDTFTKFFMDAYNVSFGEAAEMKVNLLGRDTGQKTYFADIKDVDKLKDLFEQFALELQRSFDYYQATYREGPIHELILSGGGSLMQHVDSYFKEALGMSVTIDDPFKKLYFTNKDDEIDFSGKGPIFTTVIGLALRKD